MQLKMVQLKMLLQGTPNSSNRIHNNNNNNKSSHNRSSNNLEYWLQYWSLSHPYSPP